MLLVLTIGVVVASDVDGKLKTPSDYGNIENGCATYRTYSDRILFIEKAYPSVQSAYFENETNYVVKPVGDNIYFFEDDALNQYGYCELVEIDGEKYAVSVFQKTKLSPSEEKELLDHIKEFNKINNLTPIAV